MKTELWGSIPGFPNYEASTKGRIRNIQTQRILSPNNNGKGYLSVQLGRNNRRYIHRIVAATFIAMSDMEINHIDLNKANNSVENLEYITRKKNQQHMTANGRQNKSKLTYLQRIEIRISPLLQKELAKKFNVSRSTISAVQTRKTWSWE